jgi:uncharacterized protein (TIGR02996 family)
MSDERAGFLAAIREAPEDDAPRLVFADWLEDHGDEQRAEFIRAQVLAARLDDLDPQRIRLDRRAAALLKKNEKKWLTPVRRIAQTCEVDRGFPRNVVVNSAKFREKGEALLALEPIWSVRPTGLRSDAKHIEELMRGLAGVRELAIENQTGMSSSIRVADWQKILTSPALESVRTLVLENNSLPVASHQTLFETPHLRNVRRLVLGQPVASGSRHLAGVTSPAVLSSLEEIHFSAATELTPDALALWVERLPWSQLTRLTLPGNAVGPSLTFPTDHLQTLRVTRWSTHRSEDVGRILGGASWPELRRLELDYFANAATLTPLTDPTLFPTLRAFRVNLEQPFWGMREEATAETLRTWAGSALVGQLEELTIDCAAARYGRRTPGNGSLPSTVEQFLGRLLDRPRPLRLRKLVLRRATLTSETLSPLLSSGMLPELEGIAFPACQLPDDWVEILAKTSLPKLRAIGVSEEFDEGRFGPLLQRFGEDGVRWKY